MSASGRALSLVWATSGLAFLPALDSPQLSRTALLLLPWVLWAGWPAEVNSTGPEDLADSETVGGWKARLFPALGLALPLVAFGVGLDRASGWSLDPLVRTVGVGLLSCVILAAVRADFERAGGRLSASYRVGWTAILLLPPVFVGISSMGTGDLGSVSRWASAISPLGWCLQRLTPDLVQAPRSVPDGYPSLAVVFLAWSAAALVGRRGTR